MEGLSDGGENSKRVLRARWREISENQFSPTR